MIIEQQSNFVDTNMTGQDIDFQISDDIVIFEVLRSKMYDSPIQSIVREITSNARDANIEADKPDVPIRISLPGDYFLVSDDGIGLSPERMVDVYCRYGKSTKRDDNTQAGAYGLGSKSPFAYTDSFFVETVSAGRKYVYLCYIDESGKGKIKLVDESDAGSSVGTTVKIPMKAHGDRRTFTDASYVYTQYWKVQPKMIGGSSFGPKRHEVVAEGNRWVMLKTPPNHNIIYSGVPYHRGAVNLHNFQNSSIAFKFETGELDVTSNRENLQLTAKTQAAVDLAIKEFKEYTINEFKPKLEACEDMFSAHQLFNCYFNDLPFQPDETFRKWNGHKFADSVMAKFYTAGDPSPSRISLTMDKERFLKGSLYFDMELKQTGRRKARIYMRENNLTGVHLVDDEALKILFKNQVKLTKLSEIKIDYHKTTPGKKTAITSIYVRTTKANYGSVEIKLDSTDEFLYTSLSNWSKYRQFREATVYYLTASQIKLVETLPNWTEIHKYADDEVKKVTTKKIDEYYWAVYNKGLVPNHFDFLKGVCEEIIDEPKADNKLNNLIKLAIKVGVLSIGPRPETHEQRFYKKYPLLKHMNYWETQESKPEILEYVKLKQGV